MRVSIIRFALPVAVIVILFGLGCKGSITPSLEPAGDMVKINIFNAATTLRPGQAHAAGATGIYAGTATYTITAVGTWASSNADVIEFIGKGIYRAVGGGTATITCSYKGVTSAPVEITVEGPPIPGTEGPEPVFLASIAVVPTWASVAINGTVQFDATAMYSNGTTQPITNLVDWRVSDDNPGFIIDADNAAAWGALYGLFRATGPVGTTVVSCEYMGVMSNYVTTVVKQF